MKDLIKIYICGKFHQYAVAKLKIFEDKKFFCIDSASIKWPFWGFFGPLLPQILFDLSETLTRGSLQ